MLLPALAACAGGEARCGDSWCGTAVVAVGASPNTLMPPFTSTTVESNVVDLIYLKLADIGTGMNTFGDEGFQPRLAKTWSFDDSVTISFELNREARWQDGAPVDAYDVAFTFDLYTDTTVNSSFATLITNIASVQAVDSETVIFRFRKPYPEQFFDATQIMSVLPRHLLDTIPRNRLANHAISRTPVGDGPYRLREWIPGESIDLIADSLFFLGRPGLRRIIWRITPDFSTALRQVVSGEADILETLVGIQNIERARNAPQLKLVEYASPLYGFIVFNFRNPKSPGTPHPLFGERDLRRALTMAVDRKAIVRAVFGDYGEVPPGPVARIQWIWSDSLETIPYDLERARETLARLGWTDTDGDGIRERDGRKLEFDLLVPSSSQVRRQAAVILQEQLSNAGVRMSISELEPNLWVSRSTGGNFDATFSFWSADPTPGSIPRVWGSGGIGGANYGAYSDRHFDELITRASNARALPEAKRLWHEALSYIVAEAPAIWLMSPKTVAAVHERFENVSIRPDQWAANLWMWTVPAGRTIERDRVITP